MSVFIVKSFRLWASLSGRVGTSSAEGRVVRMIGFAAANLSFDVSQRTASPSEIAMGRADAKTL
jgi:hypothetical protein